MGSLFNPDVKAQLPPPPPPMPDPYDVEAKRAKRKEMRRVQNQSSTDQNQLAPVPGTIGREFSRSTLGSS